MSFLHPWALVGLSAALIPVILHLITQRRPPTIVFPAVRYLVAATREHQRRLRLRNLLLLLVRTALVVALVLAAAAPSVPLSGLPGHLPSALVIVLDNSASSGATVGGTARLEELKEAAGAVLARATPEDEVWLVTAAGLVSGGRGNRSLLRVAIDSLGPSDLRLDLGAALTRADLIVAAGDRPAEIVLVSDLQRSAVSPADPRARLVVVRPTGPSPRNRGVASIRTGPQPWLAGSGRLVLTVAGDSGPPVPVTVAVGRLPERRALALVGEPVTVRIPGLAPGWWPVEVALDADELRADDGRVAALRVAPVAGVSWDEADRHVAAAAAVLEANGRLVRGTEVRLGGLGRMGTGARMEGAYSVVYPPADQAALGALDRALARRGVRWRFGAEVVVAERSDSGPLLGPVAVARRRRLVPAGPGAGGVLATVAGEPWIVRDAGVVLLGSRIDPGWTDLPLTAGFMPFMDALVNRVARGEVSLLGGAPGQPTPLPDLVDEVRRGTRRWRVEGGAPFTPPGRGLYYLLEGGDTLGVLAANVDPRESLLERAADGDIRKLWRPARIVPPAGARRAAFGAGARGDLRGPLLWVALLLGLIEVGLASGRRRES